MTVDTIRVRDKDNGHSRVEAVGALDISDLSVEEVDRLASGHDVHLERRGNQTYLVLD